MSGTAGSLVGSPKPWAISAAPEMVSLIWRTAFLAFKFATAAAVSEEWFKKRPMSSGCYLLVMSNDLVCQGFVCCKESDRDVGCVL